MHKFCLFLFLLLQVDLASAKELMVDAGFGCQIRAVVEESKNVTTKADVLFLTGFSDRADNHAPLFSLLTQNGFRVISFDYPSHGKTECWSLNTHGMVSLEGLAQIVLMSPDVRSTQPLYLMGWSTGGLLTYRMLQRNAFSWREVRGAVLLAPGLSVYAVPGDYGVVTLDSLLSNPNPPHMGTISPSSPLLYPLFGADLIAASVLARIESVPNVPILMILAGDETDLYANTKKIKNWYRKAKKQNFLAYQCQNAKHELDNEIEPIGNSVRKLSLDFLNKTKLESNETCISVR